MDLDLTLEEFWAEDREGSEREGGNAVEGGEEGKSLQI